MTFKRRYIRFKIWAASLLAKPTVPSDEQMKAIKIVNRLISDRNSILSCSAESHPSSLKPRYIIKNDHLFIRITFDKIRIINGIYKYDISFNESDYNLNKVKLLFAKNIEHRLDNMEKEININVNNSLDNILTEIIKQ